MNAVFVINAWTWTNRVRMKMLSLFLVRSSNLVYMVYDGNINSRIHRFLVLLHPR